MPEPKVVECIVPSAVYRDLLERYKASHTSFGFNSFEYLVETGDVIRIKGVSNTEFIEFMNDYESYGGNSKLALLEDRRKKRILKSDIKMLKTRLDELQKELTYLETPHCCGAQGFDVTKDTCPACELNNNWSEDEN